MIETYTSAGWRDFNQRYKGVFGFYQKQDGSEVLVYVSTVTGNQVDFTDCNDNTYVAYPDKGVEFKFVPIRKRMFLMNGQPVLAQRVPARQYRRGICADNATMYGVTCGHKAVDFEAVSAYLAPIVATDPTKNSRGLLSAMFSYADEVIYLYNEPVGSVLKGKIYVSNNLFEQEMRDCIRSTGFKIEVV